jgi:hypothetical protein
MHTISRCSPNDLYVHRIWGTHSCSYECRSCTLVSCSADFLPWRWRRYLPPKHWFTYGLHGAISRKKATFDLLIRLILIFVWCSHKFRILKIIGTLWHVSGPRCPTQKFPRLHLSLTILETLQNHCTKCSRQLWSSVTPAGRQHNATCHLRCVLLGSDLASLLVPCRRMTCFEYTHPDRSTVLSELPDRKLY